MAKDGERETAYVRKVQVGTRRYVERLLKENETLRTLLLKTESEKLALDEKVLTIQAQLSRHEIEQVSLRRKMAEIEVNNQRFTKEYLEIEHQNANLANLYVTSYRLHGTLERDEVLSVIQEILINLVGSEEVAVFELDEDGEALTLASSFGIDEERYRSVAVGSDVIGKVAETGEAFFGNEDPEDDAVTACIALKVEDKVTGVITVFGLLPQKSGLEAVRPRAVRAFGYARGGGALFLRSRREIARRGRGRWMTHAVPLPELGVSADAVDGAKKFYLHPGRLFVSTEPATVTTILGSCVAVCLWVESRGIGGLNHYLLPDGEGIGAATDRFAPLALRRLLDELIELGARKENLKAKVFGGACVLEAFQEDRNDLGSQNVEAARHFLEVESIPIIVEDVGGRAGRKLVFHTEDGSAWVRKL